MGFFVEKHPETSSARYFKDFLNGKLKIIIKTKMFN